MANNNVAALFGKKLGESFYIKYPKSKNPIMVKIEENGLWYAFFRNNEVTWFDDDTLLMSLLEGQAEIIDEEEAVFGVR